LVERREVNIGDLVAFSWRAGSPTIGIVLGVHPPPNSHSGIDYTLELLEPDGRRIMYDVFRGGSEPEVISVNPAPCRVELDGEEGT
jgi:hypothetical protein